MHPSRFGSLLVFFVLSVLAIASAHYTDDGVEMLEAHAKTEAFGQRTLAKGSPLYFATPAVHLPDGMFDATVGQELFQHSVLSLDFHDIKVWMAD